MGSSSGPTIHWTGGPVVVVLPKVDLWIYIVLSKQLLCPLLALFVMLEVASVPSVAFECCEPSAAAVIQVRQISDVCPRAVAVSAPPMEVVPAHLCVRHFLVVHLCLRLSKVLCSGPVFPLVGEVLSLLKSWVSILPRSECCTPIGFISIFPTPLLVSVALLILLSRPPSSGKASMLLRQYRLLAVFISLFHPSGHWLVSNLVCHLVLRSVSQANLILRILLLVHIRRSHNVGPGGHASSDIVLL
jgi:hypothetical protein